MRTLLPVKPTTYVGSFLIAASVAAVTAAPSIAQTAPPLPVPSSAAAEIDQPVGKQPTTGGPTASDISNHIIVVWRSGTTTAARSDARDASSTSAVRRLGNPRFQLLRPQTGQSVEDALASLRANPDVEAVQRDGFSTPETIPNDPFFPLLWGLRNTGAGVAGVLGTAGADADVVPAWDRTVGTPSTVVADLDTGYDFVGPELGPVAWSNPLDPPGGGDNDGNGLVDDYRGYDFVGENSDVLYAGDNNPTDTDLIDGGHGLHTAGTIGAKGNNGVGLTGVAQNARIMPLRICSYSTIAGGARCPFSSQVSAINYAGSHHARAANMSIGGTSGDQAVLAALAANPGTLYVISAGNDTQNNDVVPHYPCNYNPATSGVPGAIDNVICVAASDQNDAPAWFSDYGVRSVDIAAPGTETLSTFRATLTYVKDDFQVNNFGTNWAATGFGRVNTAPLTSFGIRSSFGPSPGGTASSAQQNSAVAVPANAGPCHIEGNRNLDNAIYPISSYSVLIDGVANAFAPGSNSPANTMVSFASVDFTAAGHTVALRFDHAPTADSQVWLDDVAIVCTAPATTPAGYAFLQGTSMAAPHVTGAAALLVSLKPSATVTEVRNAILSSAKKLPQWNGVVATGGRLDVAAAMGKLVPPNTIIKKHPPAISRSTVAFLFARESAAAATFKCRLDTAAYFACPAAKTFSGLRVGRHTVSVFATDLYGNADLTPAAFTWKVGECVVPKLKGKSLAGAKIALTKAGCTLGKVTKPKGVANSQLKVKSSTPVKGVHKPYGFAVKLTMVRR
jgi:subtilisin family serine protease